MEKYLELLEKYQSKNLDACMDFLGRYQIPDHILPSELDELKASLLSELIQSSAFYISAPDEYKEVVYNEIVNILQS